MIGTVPWNQAWAERRAPAARLDGRAADRQDAEEPGRVDVGRQAELRARVEHHLQRHQLDTTVEQQEGDEQATEKPAGDLGAATGRL